MGDQTLESNGNTKGEQHAANHGRIPEIHLRFQCHTTATELGLWETPFSLSHHHNRVRIGVRIGVKVRTRIRVKSRIRVRVWLGPYQCPCI